MLGILVAGYLARRGTLLSRTDEILTSAYRSAGRLLDAVVARRGLAELELLHEEFARSLDHPSLHRLSTLQDRAAEVLVALAAVAHDEHSPSARQHAADAIRAARADIASHFTSRGKSRRREVAAFAAFAVAVAVDRPPMLAMLLVVGVYVVVWRLDF